jgi:hypothetical protein
MHTYIVKTEDGYLYLYEGKVSFTDDESHAGHFRNEEEAHVTAQLFGYSEVNYKVIPVACPVPG